MLGTRKIKRKIRSVNNIRKITRAMEMVSAAKLKKVQSKLQNLRPYAARLKQGLSRLLTADGVRDVLKEYSHLISLPGLDSADTDTGNTARAAQKKTVIIITSNKGLCGSYNTNIIKAAANFISQNDKVALIPLGRKALDYFTRRDYPIKSSRQQLPADMTVAVTQEIIKPLIPTLVPPYGGAHLRGDSPPEPGQEIWAIYSEFINPMVSKVRVKRVIPIDPEPEKDSAPKHSHETQADAGAQTSSDCLFEPGPAEIIRLLLPRYIDVAFYQILLGALASEHSARMLAMRSATENASEVIDHLTMTFNKARQASITKELLDIVGGAEAMKG